MQPYDHDLSVKGYENAAEAVSVELELGDRPLPITDPHTPSAEDTATKTLRGQTHEETVEIARKGGKARQLKLRIEKSRELAEERRERRRAAHGVTIHHDYRAWNKLTKKEQDAFDAVKISHGVTTYPETGLRWDFDRDFKEEYSGKFEGVQHLNHLFRSGRAGRSEMERTRSPYVAGVGTSGFRGEA